MISQVSLLYPVNTLIEPAKEQELDSFPSSSRSGNILVDENVLISLLYIMVGHVVTRSNFLFVVSHQPKRANFLLFLIFSFSLLCVSGNPNGYKHFSQRTLTISGLQLSMLPFKKTSFFTDKKEVQRSATALGYVAHVCTFLLTHYHCCDNNSSFKLSFPFFCRLFHLLLHASRFHCVTL